MLHQRRSFIPVTITKMSRVLFGVTLLGLAMSAAAAPTDSLRSGFLSPPNSAKPQTWWHWMNGNISKAGITADLEAMHRVGISEANIITIGFNLTPAGSVPTMSPQFLDMVDFAAQEAD